jgi:tetratricopeptide (TPR) repeat protein
LRERAPKSPALRRLGMATPPPFIGRHEELASITRALDPGGHTVAVVHGPVGSGKTRLAQQVMERMRQSRPVAYVGCLPRDRGVAVWSRAERAMDLLPGALASTLGSEPWLLILDDAHHLAGEDAARTLAALLPDSERAAGRVLMVTRDALPLRRNLPRFEMALEGLDPGAARALWSFFEELYGPTRQGACDQALVRTRGMPLALRREYARAALGHDAWDTAALGQAARAALEAMAVVRVPVAPAGIAAMVPDAPAEDALADLVVRQLIDPMHDGRFLVHDVVRDQVLGAMQPGRRSALERAAAELILGMGKGPGRRPAWEAGDDGALGSMDPVDRMREAALHLLSADEPDVALGHVLSRCEPSLRRGGCGEVLALLDILRASVAETTALDSLRVRIAARRGRVAEALEIGVSASRIAGQTAQSLHPADAALLCYRAGDLDGARRLLQALLQSEDPDERCRAAAALVEIELACGDADAAEILATGAFERDRAAIAESVRARLHMALAAVYTHAGRISAARAALSRAASAGSPGADLAAHIEARRGVCLAWEGRLSDAEAALVQAERTAREVDAEAVADEIRHCRSLVAMRRGDLVEATELLHQLVTKRRQLGDEIGALAVEIDLARALVRRGEIARADELIAACTGAAARRGLHGLLASARLCSALIDMTELRLDAARAELASIAVHPGASAVDRAEAAALGLLARACQRDEVVTQDRARELAGEFDTELARALDTQLALAAERCDDIDASRARAHLFFMRGHAEGALGQACATIARAERAGRRAELAEALALSAHLLFARGDKAGAAAAATRAAREARRCGLTAVRLRALLVLAAVAREEGDARTAIAHVTEVAETAATAGLSIERLVAAEAAEVIHGGTASHPGQTEDGHVRSTARATMSRHALDSAARILADLGLTSARPYRVVLASGVDSFVAAADPERLRMSQRSLAIDGVRELIIRKGEILADLRRRTLLKRLLFLFAAAPGKTFSKEDLVLRIWELDYHPLRHDAALFTNIMRIRRLLGEDGAELIRVSEEGYRFVPPADFLFLDNATGD